MAVVARSDTHAQTTDLRIDSLIDQAAARLEVIQTPGSGPRVDLTLEDAIARALERNLDLAVQRLNPLVFDLSLAQQLSFYGPTISSNISNSSRTSPSSKVDKGCGAAGRTRTVVAGPSPARINSNFEST